jgi:hypothetical protein
MICFILAKAEAGQRQSDRKWISPVPFLGYITIGEIGHSMCGI